MGVVVLTDVVQFWMLLVAAITQGIAFGFLGPTQGGVHLGDRRP